MADFESVYQRSIQNPAGFWWDRVLDESKKPALPLVRRRASSTPATTRWTGMSRAGRGDQPAIIYDSPSPTRSAPTPSRAAATRSPVRRRAAPRRGGEGRPRHHLHADGARGGDRDARLRAHRRGAQRRVRRVRAKELATRIDDAKPKVIVSASCGIEPKRTIEYKPLLDEAIELAACKPEWCVDPPRPQVRGDAVEGRDLDWTRRSRGRARRLRPGRGDRSALHPLHLGHDGRAQGRACATTAGTRSALLDDEEHL
jgi:propionyl-CoA synthetase